jgi:hypothetical protein
MPFLEEYNALRKKVLRVMYLMLDESMSEWRPKTSKREDFLTLAMNHGNLFLWE